MIISNSTLRVAIVFRAIVLCILPATIRADDVQPPAAPAAYPAKATTAVGMVGKIAGIVIPGGEVEALPDNDPLAKFVVRVAETYRHGDSYRYDLEFTGFEPGRFDLARGLKRKNPADTAIAMPPIEIVISGTLPPGRMEPTRPEPPAFRPWTKYWTKLNIFAGCWILGLALLFVWSNRVEKAAAGLREVARTTVAPATVAERLRPLVLAACDGSIQPHARAELESLLIAYWTDRLHFDDAVPPGLILSKLKADAQAGPLVSKLEEWLHMPPGAARASASEIAGLLKPYENVVEAPPGQPTQDKGSELKHG